MKKGLLILVLLVFGWVGVASAVPFSDTIDFTGSTFTAGGVTKDGMWINDTPNTTVPGTPGYDFAYTYQHNVTFNPEAASVNSAFLDVTYTGNRANYLEAWFIFGLGELEKTQTVQWFLGIFPITTYSWATTTFDLSSLIAGVTGSSWSVVFSVDENTLGDNEIMFLSQSKIYGDFTPVPEPGTLLLLGAGIAGLALYRRRSMKK